MQKIIDTKNGNFKLRDKLLIDTQYTFSQMRKMFPKNKIWIIGNGYQWIYFNIPVDDFSFKIGVCYFGEKIYLIDLTFQNINNEKSLTWEEWEEEKKLEEKKYKKWIEEQLGKKKSFHWGKVEIYKDPRSDSIGIFIKYI